MNDMRQYLTDEWAWVAYKALLTKAETSGADVSMPLFEPQEDILNITCDKNSQNIINCNKLS